jgi:hypothetical protein
MPYTPYALTGFAPPSPVGHKLEEDTEDGSNDDELELEDEELDEEERELDELLDGEVDEDELDDDKLDEDESGMTFTLQIGSGTKG